MIAVAIGLLLASTSPSAPDDGQTFSLAESRRCSEQLAAGKKLNRDDHRRCIVAIASTYIQFEQNTLAGKDVLFADDVARHIYNIPAVHTAGEKAKIAAGTNQQAIAAIRNRQWDVDVEGDSAWVVYDGYLKAAPDKVGFLVVERFKIVDGKIKTITIASAKFPGAKLGNCIE